MPIPWEAVTNLFILILIAVAALTDLRRGKVYNWLTVPAVGAGLLLGGLAAGGAGVLSSFQGLALGLGMLLLSVLLAQPLGGGDVKLLAALGALGGPVFLLKALVLSILIGGALALGLALSRRVLLPSVRRLAWSVYGRFVLSTAGGVDAAPGAALRFPYAVPIAAGTLATMLWMG